MITLRVDAITPDPASMETAAAAIRAGRLVVVPTDTLYGVAADPWNGDAIRRLFSVKGRATTKALPLMAADLAQVTRQIGPLDKDAQRLAAHFWPGPLTLLLPVPGTLVAEVSGGTGRIGVRVPDHAVARALCRACDRPLTATSANISGQPASADPVIAVALFSSGGDAVPGAADGPDACDVLLDAGLTPGGQPSTIVDVIDGGVRLVRAGAIPWERIQACLHP